MGINVDNNLIEIVYLYNNMSQRKKHESKEEIHKFLPDIILNANNTKHNSKTGNKIIIKKG